MVLEAIRETFLVLLCRRICHVIQLKTKSKKSKNKNFNRWKKIEFLRSMTKRLKGQKMENMVTKLIKRLSKTMIKKKKRKYLIRAISLTRLRTTM